MAAYLLANVDVSDPEAYKEYLALNTELVKKHGGRFVVRGGKVEVLEGEWTNHRVVLIEFPDGEAARAWYHDPEYEAIKPIRQRNTRSAMLAFIESSTQA